MNNNAVIKTLTIYGESLKKLYKVLPEDCIKATPDTKSDGSNYDLEVNINGVIFTGKDDKSNVVINSSNRNYTKEELMAFQKIAIKCYTYPFGALSFSFELNIFSNNKTEETIRAFLNKYEMESLLESVNSEGHIELGISNVNDFSIPAFIDFILELQTLTSK